MIGVIVNTLLVIIGSILGVLLKKGISDRIKTIVITALGLFTCIIGIKMGLEIKTPLVVVISLVLGGVIGELFKIEDFLERLGRQIQKKVRIRDETSFAQGFVFASLLFCIGPMTILGSLQAGLQNQPELLYIKSMMDGVSAIILTAALGLGVIFSAATVLIIQGSLVVLAQHMTFLNDPFYLSDFTSVGGIIIFAIGIRLLGVKEIKAGNYLPALVFVLLLLFISRLLS